MATHSSIPAWRITTDRGAWLVTYSPWGCRVEHDWETKNSTEAWFWSHPILCLSLGFHTPWHTACTPCLIPPTSFLPLFDLFLQYLFPGHKFLFLQCLLGYLFLLCHLLFWFRNNLFFFSKDHLTVAGRAHVWVDPTMSSVCPAPHLGSFVHRICSMTRESTSKPLSSALLSAFLSMCSKNSALFLGHQPCIQPHYLACAHLPTLPF